VLRIICEPDQSVLHSHWVVAYKAFHTHTYTLELSNHIIIALVICPSASLIQLASFT